MLVLTRKLNEKIAIGEDIVVHILEIKGSQVRIGIEAPKGVGVHRQEVYERIQAENRSATQVQPDDLDRLEGLCFPVSGT